MKYAHIEGTKILGWYDKEIHEDIPEPNIEVEDDEWQQAIDISANAYGDDGFFVEDFVTEEEKIENALAGLKGLTKFDSDVVVDGIAYRGGYESAQRLNAKRLLTIERGHDTFEYVDANDGLISLTVCEAREVWIAIAEEYENAFHEYKAKKREILLNKQEI